MHDLSMPYQKCIFMTVHPLQAAEQPWTEMRSVGNTIRWMRLFVEIQHFHLFILCSYSMKNCQKVSMLRVPKCNECIKLQWKMKYEKRDFICYLSIFSTKTYFQNFLRFVKQEGILLFHLTFYVSCVLLKTVGRHNMTYFVQKLSLQAKNMTRFSFLVTSL